jgi:predicted DNA-binding protein
MMAEYQPTSIYLDNETREKLRALSETSGESRSQVMRGLIRGADEESHRRIAEILTELNELMGAV